jgi:hypothetical protein
MEQLPPMSFRTSWTTPGRALHRAPVVLGVVALVLAWAGPAAATTKDEFTITVDYPGSFTCPDGHAVEITRDGFIKVTVFRNSSGTITESVDTRRVHYTVSSPDTGKGWSSWQRGNDRYDYSAGTEIGAPVTLTSVGSGFQTVPGVGSEHGIQVFVGTIVGYADADDVPMDDFPDVDVDYDNPIFSAGHHPAVDLCATTI